MIKKAFIGPVYLLKGVQFLLKPSLAHYLVIPLLINLLLFSTFLYVGIRSIGYFTHFLPHAWHWLAPVFETLFFVVSTVTLAYIFTMVTNFIGAPFNSFLSSKTEGLVIGKKPFEEDTWKDVLKDLPRFFKREKDKIVYYLPRAFLLLILFFIPVVNIAAGVFWFVFNSWMMGIQYLDYPMDNHKMTFEQTKQYLREHRWISFTFGLSVMVTSMIPFLNLIVMPASVIGATLLYIDLST